MGAVAAALATPQTAQADVVLPKKGKQYFTAGMSLDPGFLYDSSASELDEVPSTSLTAATMASLGVTQIINRSFFMAAEGRLGMQWLDDNTAAKSGEADSSKNFAWQLGLYGHWLPFEDELGLVAVGGMHLFQIHADDAPLQVLGAELRLGKYIWTANEDFLLVQIGYSAPFIQGFNRPTEFTAESEWTERNWTFHRFTLGFQYGF
ncbi:MAG: hypothetical protein ACLFVJ_05590 [Persicimonas sp.]